MNVEAVKLLLSHLDININLRDRRGNQPYDVCFAIRESHDGLRSQADEIMALFDAYNDDF